MSTKTMRPTKDGGFSICAASEENVGKRRCPHVSGMKFSVEVNNIERGLTEIVVSNEYNDLNDDEKIEVIKGFISSLSPVGKRKVKAVLNELGDID